MKKRNPDGIKHHLKRINEYANSLNQRSFTKRISRMLLMPWVCPQRDPSLICSTGLNFKDIYPKPFLKLQKAGAEKQLFITECCRHNIRRH
ncbi:hypothetical protein KOW79_010882 [Hemibagrus wyckioides]|uniref:Uncharacterized protein n=1 Tax=Hemibagrus wyckioides TaxID=337641 RepID=A0A9D3SJ35_9TELE|nr:hypothetical protein KOW79_010882 [Hemibagrus wyckioides]